VWFSIPPINLEISVNILSIANKVLGELGNFARLCHPLKKYMSSHIIQILPRKNRGYCRFTILLTPNTS
jgi:hypothetical protein